jgi:hypothetical protein
MLAVLLKNAKAWGWTPQDLMDGVNPITNIRDERTRFLSDKERTRFLDACKASDNDYLFTVVVIVVSGQIWSGQPQQLGQLDQKQLIVRMLASTRRLPVLDKTAHLIMR